MHVPQRTTEPPHCLQPQLLEDRSSQDRTMQPARRTSSSAHSNNSTTDFEETFSDLDSVQDVTASTSPSDQSSRTTSPGEHSGASHKKGSKTAGLRLSLKNLRAPKASSPIPTDSDASLDPSCPRRSTESGKAPSEHRISLEVPLQEGRTSLDSLDPRRRSQLASPPQLSASAPKAAARFSFIHSPTPFTPTMARPTHHRSNTTPTHSPNPSTYGTSPRRAMASPSPQPVKETHTMMKDYDPMTGNKMINKYMVVRELGRGVHGKVKLCRDTVTDELCVRAMHEMHLGQPKDGKKKKRGVEGVR